MVKIKFYLMGFKGYQVLKKVIDTYGHEIINSVVCSKDKNVINDYYYEIYNICETNEIKFYERKDDKENCDCYAIAIGWRWIIDQKKSKDLIVLHDSILPKYRGFNPLVSALINGENEVGVTAIFASDRFDEGDIISISKSYINYPIKIQEAIKLVTINYIDLILKIIQEINDGHKLSRIVQNDLEASYSLWRDELDYRIDWSKDNKYIRRFIDAVGFPYKGAFSYIGNRKIRILNAEEHNDLIIVNRIPGKVLFVEEGCPIVVCGKGLLKVTKMIDENNNDYSVYRLRIRFS